MKDQLRKDRQDQIENAAYELLGQKGYAGASMLSIAKRAKCSNETLYNWYGDKVGLFRSMVARNAQEAKALLGRAIAPGDSVIEILRVFGPLLLEILLSEKAICLNRAAAADPSGVLGQTLSEAGRETIRPMLMTLFETAQSRGEMRFDDAGEAVDLYFGLLIGDLQIRRVIGRAPVPDKTFIHNRAERAVAQIQALTK